jgi:tetratricopeptide (TPR) repeat protein
MLGGINIGVRHVLPVYPLAIVAAAIPAAWCLRGSRVRRAALGLLTLFWVVRFAGTYPNTLTFFSAAVGGSENGHRYLVDSNLDWGQHLKQLKRWMDANSVAHVNLAYFGTADPGYYGINCTYLPGSPTFVQEAIAKPRLPGYVAVSATVLNGVYLTPSWRLFYRSLATDEPVTEIGHSIRVYWVGERWPEDTQASDVHGQLADGLLTLKWYDHAVLHYRKHLERHPLDAAMTTRYAAALWATGATEEALEAFRRAASLDPTNAVAHRDLATALIERGLAVEAADHGRRAVSLRPDDPAAHDILGRALMGEGRLLEAEHAFEQAVRIAPGDPGVRKRLDRVREIIREARRRSVLSAGDSVRPRQRR